jgi:DNA-binding NarL/FixJ family response regulator
MSLRIGLVDDHPAFLLGLGAILNTQRDMQVVAAAPTVRGLIGERIRLDVVLLDLVLADGSTPTRNVERLAVFKAPVIAVAVADQPVLLREAISAGVVGAIGKSETPERIIEAVRRGSRREFAPEIDDAAQAAADIDAGILRLSEREVEVLTLYAAGHTADHVANALFISRDTVNDHIRRIRAKYAASGRPAPTKVDLFKRAVEDGLVPPHR